MTQWYLPQKYRIANTNVQEDQLSECPPGLEQ